MYFVLTTLGCKVNQYESNNISSAMESSGFKISDNLKNADIFIINSCTVTENSDKKVKQLIQNARKQNETLVIALIGCFSEAFPTEAKNLSADIIIGTAGRSELPGIIIEYLSKRNVIPLSKNYFNQLSIIPQINSVIPSEYEEFFNGKVPASNQTRAYIKIEDGCNRFCSYCIIPKSRGRVRSRNLDDIKKEAELLIKAGHKELVLVGINLSCYGIDIGLTLCDAVETIAKINGIFRIRLSSLEPDFLDESVIKRLAKQGKLCPHFHLSLQSGCDETLLRMNRHYNGNDYKKIVDNLRFYFKNCAITTDVMVGFAGESDDEFLQSMDFVKYIGFFKVHVFTYSIRKGTKAANRTDHISSAIKSERYDRMSILSNELEQAYLKSQIGLIHEVLIEKQTKPEFVFGHTRNYVPIRIYDEKEEQHSILKVKIMEVKKNYCIAVKYNY